MKFHIPIFTLSLAGKSYSLLLGDYEDSGRNNSALDRASRPGCPQLPSPTFPSVWAASQSPQTLEQAQMSLKARFCRTSPLAQAFYWNGWCSLPFSLMFQVCQAFANWEASLFSSIKHIQWGNEWLRADLEVEEVWTHTRPRSEVMSRKHAVRPEAVT